MNTDIQALISEATDLVNAGNFAEALNKADAALAIDPSSGQAALARAVSLSQLGNSSDASAAFDLAIRLAPGEAKARFNAAIHEFNMGNIDVARSLNDQALQLDPNHEGAKGLQSRFPVAQSTGTAEYPRTAAFGTEPPAGLPFITKLGPRWVMIGWIISAVALGLFVMQLIPQLENFSEIWSAAVSNNQAKVQELQLKAAQNQNMGLVVVELIFRILCILWGLLDLIHRKGQMVWLVPHLPCSCCGLGWITLPIYILFGRK